MPKIPWQQLAYHQQERTYYCGAACAQMLLHSARVGQPLTNLHQEDLFHDIGNLTPSAIRDVTWAASPDGLTSVLNAEKGNFPNTFQLFTRDTSALDATQRILNHLGAHPDADGVAAIALVFGNGHWVLVRGYTFDVANPNTLQSLDIYNPYPAVPEASGNIFLHQDFVDGCGTGGDRGYVLDNLAYTAWVWDYLTGWNGVFLTICDPEPGAYPDEPQHRGSDMSSASSKSREGFLNPREAPQKAIDGLRAFGLADDEEWRPLIDQTQPGPVHLVVRPDPNAVPYYIVIFVSHEGAPLAVRVDARTGDYLEAIGVPQDLRASVLTILDEKTVRERLLQNEHLRIKEDDLKRSKLALTWKPCVEFFSPFAPFYVLSTEEADAGAPQTEALRLYISAASATPYTHLTTNIGGA